MRMLLRPRPTPLAITVGCPACAGLGLAVPAHSHRDPDTCSICVEARKCETCRGGGYLPGPGGCLSCFAEHDLYDQKAEPGTQRCRACRELDEEAEVAARSVA